MAYTSSDYSDIFCQAVQNIVNQAVGQLEFDISKECTVIKINNRAYGKYQLSDGSISFEAVAAEGATYEVGDQVIATIPRGDYNQQISILNKVVDEWSGPAGWVRPLDTLMRCTGNVAIGASSAALIANGNISFVNVLDLNNEKFFGFRKIGIVAKFKSLLGGLNVIDGSYGLLMTLKAGGQKHVCDFSESKMLGNPYEFATYFSQEYVFDIPENFNNIDSIQLDFYQKSNFKDGNNNVIDHNENILTLFVDDIEVYFGYDSSRELNSIVEITCDDLAYNLHQSTKDLSLVWFHKIDNNVMKQITTEDTSGTNPTYFVRWYQYCPGCKSEGEDKETDEYGGDNWKWINKEDPDLMWPTYPFKMIAHMRAIRTQERFKAICFVATYPLVNDETYVVYEQYASNELVFENTEDSTNGGESLSDTIKSKFSLRFRDNSQGIYYIYDQNGDIINLSDGSKDRYVELVYNHGEVWPYQNLAVEWQYPQNNTMIRLPSVEEENGLKVFKYSIDTILRDEAINNTIQCLVYIDNILVYTIQEEMQFGKKGSNGTGNTFILDMLDGKNAICLTDSDDEENGTYVGLKVQAILIRESGKRFYFTEEEKAKIAWELIYPCENINLNKSGDIVTLTMTSTTIPDENYTILKASYKYEESNNSPTLEAYLPIPIKISNDYNYLIGCKQILYNHQGIPKYNDGAYELRSEENVDVSYELVQPTKTVDAKTIIDNPNPVVLKDCVGGGYGLSAAALYSKYDNRDEIVQDKVCICCKNGENIVWSQPILIMQSRYDFAMLNSWDGGLTIDENNGTILSTMLGAGRKNEQNQFSGVLIGDLQGGTDLKDTETMTGVYGLQNGILTYGLRENGSAFFGAYNRGRIEIDGTSGIIRSAGWVELENGKWRLKTQAEADKGQNDPYPGVPVRASGALIDLDDGMFLLKANDNNYFYFNENKSGNLKIKALSSDGEGFSFDTSSGLTMTVSSMNITLSDQGNKNLKGYIQATEEGITSKFEDADKKLSSQITQTANSITSEVRRTAGYSCTMTKSTTGDKYQEWKFSDIKIGDKTITDIFYSGVTLAATFGSAQDKEKEENTHQIWITDKNGNNDKPLYYKGAVATSTGDNALTWAANDTLFLCYDENKTTNFGNKTYTGAWIVVDSGAYSKITQTADAINASVFGVNGLKSSLELSINGLRTEVFGPNGLKTSLETSINGVNATVTGKLDPTGTFGSCGWSITTNGFNVYKKVGNETTNLFNVDTSGNATFAGNLTATTTQFQSLQAGAVSINGTNYYSSFNAQHIEIVVGTDKNNDTGVYTNGGKLIIGAPNYSTYDDVSLYARVINETQGQVGYGNLGLPDKKWDTLSYVSIGSKRNFKQDVQVYNIEQAYEELKTLPIYTYKYKGNGDSSRTLSLGSMIDYMPIEFMRTTYTEDGTIFEPNNIIFWNIAAAQVMQSKLENIINRVEQLELKEVN